MSYITDQAEDLRKQAIALLVAERQAIDSKLALLGFNAAEQGIAEPSCKKCSVCGDPSHNARFHKKDAPENPGAKDRIIPPA
jgi:hypothetical protein